VAETKPYDIRKRSFAYARRAIKLDQFVQKLKDSAGWILGKQYLRSATSLGANLEEAQAGESRADFIHKPGVAQKEVRERLFRLRLMLEPGIIPHAQLNPLQKETEELAAVITPIIVKTKDNHTRQSCIDSLEFRIHNSEFAWFRAAFEDDIQRD
jgi:four helix bundle protein